MSSPSEERHARLSRIFEEARSVPPREREAWLDGLEEPNDLLFEVRELLSIDERDVPFLDKLESAPEAPKIEGFELLDVIGRGGMGVVWEARQQHPDRKVAIKVLASSLVDLSMARFRREIDILGRLEHTSIARIYDAGVTESRPYIVMEHVEGEPIDEFVGRSSKLEETLLLFLQVCAGVAHAHGRGIIHRDLKPANVLVTPEGQVKILDFGIARVLDDETECYTLKTRTGMVLGTLPYMSPEQARGEVGSVGAQADVYSLGVMLFEMIEGRRPIDLEGMSLSDAVGRINEAEPDTLGTTGHSFVKDVDIILKKALAKEPERRFETVAALADDIRRIINDEPILARPPSVAYLLSRFARRHRVLVAAALFSVLVLAMATAVSLSFAMDVKAANNDLKKGNRELEKTRDRLRAQRTAALEAAKRADVEARSANTFLDFMIKTLLEGDPSQQEEPSLRGAIERVAANVEGDLVEYPVARARLHRFLGKMFEALGRPIKSYEHLDLAYGLFSEHAPDHSDRQPLALELAHGMLRIERHEDALQQVESFLGELKRSGKTGTLAEAVARRLKSDILLRLGRIEEACSSVKAALAIATKIGADEERELSLHSYAGTQLWLGRVSESRALLQELLKLRRKRYPKDNPFIAETLQALGVVAIQDRKADEAIPLLQEAYEIQCASLGEEHSATQSTIRATSQAYLGLAKYDEALKAARKLKDLSIKTTGKGSPQHISALFVEGDVFLKMKDFDAASASFKESVSYLEGAPIPPDYIGVWFLIAEAENASGRFTKSLEWIEKGVDLTKRQLPDGLLRAHMYSSAGTLSIRNDAWSLARRCFQELDRLERAGIVLPDPQVVAMNKLRHGQAVLCLEGPESAESMIVEARKLIDSAKSSTDNLRESIEIEIALRKAQKKSKLVDKLKARLKSIAENTK